MVLAGLARCWCRRHGSPRSAPACTTPRRDGPRRPGGVARRRYRQAGFAKCCSCSRIESAARRVTPVGQFIVRAQQYRPATESLRRPRRQHRARGCGLSATCRHALGPGLESAERWFRSRLMRQLGVRRVGLRCVHLVQPCCGRPVGAGAPERPAAARQEHLRASRPASVPGRDWSVHEPASVGLDRGGARRFTLVAVLLASPDAATLEWVAREVE